MYQCNTDDINTFRKDEDGFVKYMHALVFCSTAYNDHAIAGRVVKITDSFIELEKRDGRIVTIRRKAVLGVELVPEAV